MMTDTQPPLYFPSIDYTLPLDAAPTVSVHALRARQWAHLCIRCLTRVKPDVRQMAHLGWRLK